MEKFLSENPSLIRKGIGIVAGGLIVANKKYALGLDSTDIMGLVSLALTMIVGSNAKSIFEMVAAAKAGGASDAEAIKTPEDADKASGARVAPLFLALALGAALIASPAHAQDQVTADPSNGVDVQIMVKDQPAPFHGRLLSDAFWVQMNRDLVACLGTNARLEDSVKNLIAPLWVVIGVAVVAAAATGLIVYGVDHAKATGP